MNQAILDEARAALASGPLPLKKLHERLQRVGSAWSEAQHHLFFLTFDGFSVEQVDGQVRVSAGAQSPEERLRQEIIKVVESFAGRPVPPQEIRKRLPPDLVTTDEQVKAIARQTGGLEVIGPGFIRIKR